MAGWFHYIIASAVLGTSIGYYKWNQKREDDNICDEIKKVDENRKWEYNLLRITGGPPGDHPLMKDADINKMDGIPIQQDYNLLRITSAAFTPENERK